MARAALFLPVVFTHWCTSCLFTIAQLSRPGFCRVYPVPRTIWFDNWRQGTIPPAFRVYCCAFQNARKHCVRVRQYTWYFSSKVVFENVRLFPIGVPTSVLRPMPGTTRAEAVSSTSHTRTPAFDEPTQCDESDDNQGHVSSSMDDLTQILRTALHLRLGICSANITA